MIVLRELEEKDIPYMIEWMRDEETRFYFLKDFSSMTDEEIRLFVSKAKIPISITESSNIHFAITENDEYMGTISLKNISLINSNAEYSISLRRKAQGKGVAYRATRLILEKAFNEYNLNRIYLSVLADNDRAIKFYNKCGFVYEGEFREHILRDGCFINWKWYGMLAEEFHNISYHDTEG